MKKKDFMKEFIYIVLMLSIGASLFGCSKNDKTDPSDASSENETIGPDESNVGDSKENCPVAYLFENSTGFSMSSGDTVEKFSYGGKLGSFFFDAEIGSEATYNDVQAYSVGTNVVFGYNSNAADFQTDNIIKWNLTDSKDKMVGDIKLDKSVDNGTIIIQKSSDGLVWENAIKPLRNAFTEKDTDLSSIYSPSEEELYSGTYYRVVVAYKMRKKSGAKPDVFGTIKATFEDRCFTEKYEFYLCYGSNPVSLYDLPSRAVITDNSTVSDGFTLDAHGANTEITVTRDSGSVANAVSFESFHIPGTYSVNVTSPIGEVFTDTIVVSDGLSVTDVPGKRYDNETKDGYNTKNGVSGKTNLTSLMIGQIAGSDIKTAVVNGYDAYGIVGDNVSLYLRLQSEETFEKSGWTVLKDSFGKKEKEKIDDVWVGPVGTGALIVQKSKNGTDWENIEDGRYANGLYTTDFNTHYGGNGDILIYSPDGDDVLNGIYIRVLYAYEIKQTEGKGKKRCIEEYAFYLCSDELGAVTFHNLSVKDQVKELCGEDNEIEMEMYETAETMKSEAVTVSGFKIDTSLNPTVVYTVKKDGVAVTPSDQTEFTEDGRYDIELKSAVGSTEAVTLYVDRMTTEETLSLYFGDGFIDGKRIFSEGDYPVFEGGLTKYNINAISESYQPLYGEITNVTTGKTIPVSASRSGMTGDLTEPGEYVVSLNNNPNYSTETPSGDNKAITFHFGIIAEGTAPGPKVNRQSLEDSIRESVTGIYPKYYGLIYSSAAAGNITLAFKTREAAFQYAYNYEKGTVELQKDGTYLYTGSFLVDQKTRFDSNWDLTDAIYYFAEQAIHEMYIDASDEATYLTLEDSVLENVENPRTLELKRSVTIFADGQEALLTDLDALPILNSRPYAFLTPGLDGDTTAGEADYEFIKDKYGCDSYTVEIQDLQGKRYSIDYNKDVEKQLEEYGFSTGVVTIHESTIYGDSTLYDAVYFADGDNTAEVTLQYYENGNQKTIELTQNDEGKEVIVEKFSIKKIFDAYDPYTIVVVEDSAGRTTSFIADQPSDKSWTEKGTYEVSVINRIGNKYSFHVTINGSDNSTISDSSAQ